MTGPSKGQRWDAPLSRFERRRRLPEWTAAGAWWAENAVPGFEARATGAIFEFARAEDEITLGRIRGLAIAVLALGLVL